MLDLLQFYGNVLSAFNKCKMPLHIDNLKRDDFLSMFLRNNRLLQYKSKPKNDIHVYHCAQYLFSFGTISKVCICFPVKHV